MTLSPRELLLQELNDPKTPAWRKERILRLLDSANIQGANKTQLDIRPFDTEEIIEEKTLGTLYEDNVEIIKQNQNVIVKDGERLEVKGNLQVKEGEVIVPATKENLEKVINQDVKEEKILPDASELRKKRLARYGKKRQGGILRYPSESLTEHTDYLQIDIEKYEAIGENYITSTGSDNRYVIGNARQNRAARTPSKKLTRKPLINAGHKQC